MSADPAQVPSKRILVAEDDATSARAMGALLERNGFVVVHAHDGQEALDLLAEQGAPSLALLDWEMPRLDGLHVARAIRGQAREPYQYLIMITGRDHATDVLTAFAAGIDDFLAKPVDPAELVARLRVGERVLALEQRLAARVAELEASLREVQTLKHLLPICTYCKRVRDDGDYWQQIETYLHEHAGAEVAHGICPECMGKVIEHSEPGDPVRQGSHFSFARGRGGEAQEL